MKKSILCIAALSLTFLAGNTAFAAALTQTGGAGEQVSFSSDSSSGGVLTFNPSTNVVFSGGTTVADGANFAVLAYHNQVLNKSQGKAFGMADDTSATFWQDISGTTDGPTIETYNSTSINGWETM